MPLIYHNVLQPPPCNTLIMSSVLCLFQSGSLRKDIRLCHNIVAASTNHIKFSGGGMKRVRLFYKLN